MPLPLLGHFASRLQVYRGRWHGRLVAAKVLPTEDPEVMEDLFYEISVLEALRHPNVVRVFDHVIGEDELQVGPY